MQRRTLLALGAGSAAVLAAAGAAALLVQPARANGQFSVEVSELWAAVTHAVLGPYLPADPSARQSALHAQLLRLQTTVSGLPPAMQAEVDQLLAVLASAPGRLALAGLTTHWRDVGAAELAQALQRMRLSSMALRQQAFHALRDLSNAAWFADSASWQALGYPGPQPI